MARATARDARRIEVTSDMLRLLNAYNTLPARERAQFLREIEVRALIWQCVIDHDGLQVAPGPLGPRAPHSMACEGNPYL
jgi:hypothetical protein